MAKSKSNPNDLPLLMVLWGMLNTKESLTLSEIAERAGMTEPEARDAIERFNAERMAAEGKLVVQLPPHTEAAMV